MSWTQKTILGRLRKADEEGCIRVIGVSMGSESGLHGEDARELTESFVERFWSRDVVWDVSRDTGGPIM